MEFDDAVRVLLPNGPGALAATVQTVVAWVEPDQASCHGPSQSLTWPNSPTWEERDGPRAELRWAGARELLGASPYYALPTTDELRPLAPGYSPSPMLHALAKQCLPDREPQRPTCTLLPLAMWAAPPSSGVEELYRLATERTARPSLTTASVGSFSRHWHSAQEGPPPNHHGSLWFLGAGLLESVLMERGASLVEAFLVRDTTPISPTDFLPMPYCPFRYFKAAIEAGKQPIQRSGSAGPGVASPTIVPYPRAVPQLSLVGQPWESGVGPTGGLQLQWQPSRASHLIHSQLLAPSPQPPTTHALWKTLLETMSPQLAGQFDLLYVRWMFRPEIGYLLDCANLGVFPVVTPPVLQAMQQMPALSRPWPGMAQLLRNPPRRPLALPLFCQPGMAPPPHEVWIPKLCHMEVELVPLEVTPAVISAR